MPDRLFRGAAAAVAALAWCSAPAVGQTESFAGVIERLSEPGGSFDTDNLISNEASYLHVLDAMARLGVRGGAYIGVGPDQNFSYIAQVKPEIAYLIDIRRDNLLLHLLFKALFAEADSRVEYLALLLGRPAPARPEAWRDAPLARLVTWMDSVPATEASATRARALVAARVSAFGVRLSGRDRETLDAQHRAFIRDGLGLRFTSHGRAPRPFYPTYRQLLMETSRSGTHGSYLAREDDYRFVRDLQRRDRVIPVVGDLGGTHAFPAIGDDIARRGLRLSVLYTSNVEFYLFGNGTFRQFASSVAGIPSAGSSVIIRSWFERFSRTHPSHVSGYGSTQVLQTLRAFVAGASRGYLDYWDVVTDAPVPPA